MRRRRGQPEHQLVLDPEQPKVLGVDLKAVPLSARDEVRKLVRRDVARAGRVAPEGDLVYQPPEGASEPLLVRLTRVDLTAAGAGLVGDDAPARLIELLIRDEI